MSLLPLAALFHTLLKLQLCVCVLYSSSRSINELVHKVCCNFRFCHHPLWEIISVFNLLCVLQVPELGVLSSDLGNSSNGYGHALGLVKVVGFSCQVSTTLMHSFGFIRLWRWLSHGVWNLEG
jgi:hypothetical protein